MYIFYSSSPQGKPNKFTKHCSMSNTPDGFFIVSLRTNLLSYIRDVDKVYLLPSIHLSSQRIIKKT